jgi:diguanylate cyclase (GGDEF)-like protein
VPLATSDDQVLGALCVFDAQPRTWPAWVVEALRDLAQATMTEIELRSALRALSRSRAELERANRELASMHADAETRSQRDEMTGLLNRRGFLEHARRAASRRQGGAVMIYADLDGLKTINDTLGHDAGDAAIVAAAAVIRAAVPGTDVIGRLGGDELAVLVTNAGIEIAEALVARIEAATQDFNETSGHEWALAISAGFAFRRADEDVDVERMLADADARMYERKRAARS